MIISNFKNLARNSLRRKALLIAEAGYRTIEIEKVVSSKCRVASIKKKDFLVIRVQNRDFKINLENFKRIYLVGIGKGSSLAVLETSKILTPLGSRFVGAMSLDVEFPISNFQFPKKSQNLKSKVQFLTGDHPTPSRRNIKASKKIMEMAKGLDEKDLLINFICGGGSSLFCGSEKEMKHSRVVFDKLTIAGADIFELNTVRKHLSQIKGGGLAKLAYPATVVSLIISDILGNDLSMVASGPTAFDKTSKKDAEKILKKFDLQPTTYNLQLLETPKQKKYFKKVKNILLLSNQEPIMEMEKKAEKFGLKTKIHSLKLKGEAKKVLPPLMKKIRKNQIVLAGGETTVTLGNRPQGKGGRNTEAVLGCLSNLTRINFSNKSRIFKKDLRSNIREGLEKIVVMSFASDGRDNSEAAGAIADLSTVKKSEELNLDPRKYLNENNSFIFFKKTNDLIFTKLKTFNVADFMIVIKKD